VRVTTSRGKGKMKTEGEDEQKNRKIIQEEESQKIEELENVKE
jgi:hypothetical protein